MVPILSFIGSSGSGKTSIMEKVVAELAGRGTKLAVIKHSHHENLGFDKAGKDSHRYAEAGAEIVVLSGKQEMVVMKKTDHDLSPHEIAEFIGPGFDLIITEGFKSADTPKIEVHRKSIETKLLAKPEQLLAVVTDEKLSVKVPQLDFNRDNTREIADLIENWLAENYSR
jgi:molybdopterin-guanine dinucleotide biosynthesis protein MobB